MKVQLTWESFAYHNKNQTKSFENLCRNLFRREFFDESILRSNPNHAGVEVEPIYSEKLNKCISFQAKYFQNQTDYSQIKSSVEKTIQHYGKEIDTFYLYCNRDLTKASVGYNAISNLLAENNIEFIPITNEELLDKVRLFNDLQMFFFGTHSVTSDWLIEQNNRSIESLGTRYNSLVQVETNTEEEIRLFSRTLDSIQRVNNKKKQLIKELDEMYFIDNFDNDIVKLKVFINDIADIDLENVEDCLDWNQIINSEFGELKSRIDDKIQDLTNKLQENRELSQDTRRKYDRIITALNTCYWTISDALIFSEIEQKLIHDKVLVLTGDAGMGKSHTIANVVKTLNSDDTPSLFLLSHYFQSSDDIRIQIMNQLGLDYNFLELLDVLNIYAINNNNFCYIFVDALNETPNRNLWKNNISVIIQEIKKRTNLKVLLSVRSGYEKFVFDENLISKIDNNEYVAIDHTGFSDNSIEAVNRFLNSYKIPFSPSDFLSYEMTNPLFLTLFCRTYSGEELNIFQMFEKYIAFTDEEVQKTSNIPDSGVLLDELACEIGQFMLAKDKNYIARQELLRLDFWNDFGITNRASFISNLVKSGFLLSVLRNYGETYSFSYNLLENYIVAKAIFKNHRKKTEILSYLENGLLKIQDGRLDNFYNIDVFLFVCCFFFKKFDEDCIFLIDKVTNEDDKSELARSYIKSLSWRPSETISVEYFKQLIDENLVGRDEVFSVLIENSIKTKNPLNAEYLHDILISKTLANRDYSWTTYINYLTYDDERLYQLIESINRGTDFSSLARRQLQLLLVLFSWLLTSSNRKLRDKTSKAMIEILKKNFSLSEYVLRKFMSVNDPYVLQRLFGIVLGACVKRLKTDAEEYKSLVEFVYENIFSQRSVYEDILLRDYARLIIERFIFDFPENSNFIDIDKIKPPYSSKNIPIVETMRYESKDNQGLNYIDFSMRPEGVGMYGDFGRYVFQAALSDFEDVNLENLYHFGMQYIINELKYDELLGIYDLRMGHPIDRSRNNAIERIGKKYQWITFYHILAKISDNNELKHYNNSVESYSGTWEPYVRDFDPTLNLDFKIDNDLLPSFEFDNQETEEYFFNEVENFDEIDNWLDKEVDFFSSQMLVTDTKGIEWIVLYQHEEIKNDLYEFGSKGIDIELGSQIIWKISQANFIRNSEFEKIKSYCTINSNHREAFESEYFSTYQMYNREFDWPSPALKSLYQSQWNDFVIKTGNVHKEIISLPSFELTDDGFTLAEEQVEEEIEETIVIGQTLQAYCSFLWEEEYDFSQSEATSFHKICPELIKGLSLNQLHADGYYFKEGELVAFDGKIDNIFNGLLIRKDFLESFLTENELKLVWFIKGEKQFFEGQRGDQKWSEWSGFYYLCNNKIDGKIDRYK